MTEKVALLLEDEPVIAMDVAQTLMEEGYFVATINSRAAALQWLEHNPAPTVAIVDIELADGKGHSVAVDLLQKGVPFVVHTGSSTLILPDDEPFSHGVFLSKPSTAETLLDAVRQAVHNEI